ncbi:MAG: alanine racemase, partial [Spirochaetaceae bacterium]|nr:alanine racemase [Spirochaetaceae bacterium]
MRATRAIIHLDNLVHNIDVTRTHISGTGKTPFICMPVKADAYGHGAVEISKTALESGCS